MILPYSEHLLEQLEWIAEDIVQREGDAYVLPVTELPEADEEDIRRRMRDESRKEYARLRDAAATTEGRELAALERALQRAIDRDHFTAAGRSGAERAIRHASKRKEQPRDS